VPPSGGVWGHIWGHISGKWGHIEKPPTGRKTRALGASGTANGGTLGQLGGIFTVSHHKPGPGSRYPPSITCGRKKMGNRSVSGGCGQRFNLPPTLGSKPARVASVRAGQHPSRWRWPSGTARARPAPGTGPERASGPHRSGHGHGQAPHQVKGFAPLPPIHFAVMRTELSSGLGFQRGGLFNPPPPHGHAAGHRQGRPHRWHRSGRVAPSTKHQAPSTQHPAPSTQPLAIGHRTG
jgi:hypothetical protein